MELTLIGFAALFVLLIAGVPIAYGMGLIGVAGFAFVVGWAPALSSLGQLTVDSLTSYSLSVLPLFLLMGNLLTNAKLSEDLYAASNALIGHWRGGLAMATILACGGFSAVCGSSLATAATMAKISIPSMRRYRYADSLATGTIAAGGTLGILIPPSIIMVIYGNLTETDIGKLFVAGILPGLLTIVLYMITIAILTRLDPRLGPPGARANWAERVTTLKGIWGVLALFALVIGGIYLGVFTPTEAAGIGASGGFLFALARGTLGFRQLIDVLVETARTSGALMIMVVGASLFSNFINVAGFPDALVGWIQGLGVTPLVVVLVIMAFYLVLGCLMDGMSMILLTVPVIYPIVKALGVDLVWFGILIVVVVEIGLITPPIGLNVFVLKSLLPEVSSYTIFRGVAPFIACDMVRLTILVLFPAVTLVLPSFMR